MCFKFTERILLLEFVHHRRLRVLDCIALRISIGWRDPPTLTVSPNLPIERVPSMQIRQAFSFVSTMMDTAEED
jgi:hypothetical protein